MGERRSEVRTKSQIKYRAVGRGCSRVQERLYKAEGEGRTPIRFWMYIIQNRPNNCLNLALRGVVLPIWMSGCFNRQNLWTGSTPVDLTYTGLLQRQYRANTAAVSRCSNGTSPNFVVKAIHQFGVNVIACQLEMVERHWYIVRCYLAPRY